MRFRKSSVLFTVLLTGMMLMGLMLAHAAFTERADRSSLHERSEIARVLGIADLCLFSEARYTRHPSMADSHTPFQDHPVSLEHFPSGAIMPVPDHLFHPTDG